MGFAVLLQPYCFVNDKIFAYFSFTVKRQQLTPFPGEAKIRDKSIGTFNDCIFVSYNEDKAIKH